MNRWRASNLIPPPHSLLSRYRPHGLLSRYAQRTMQNVLGTQEPRLRCEIWCSHYEPIENSENNALLLHSFSVTDWTRSQEASGGNSSHITVSPCERFKFGTCGGVAATSLLIYHPWSTFREIDLTLTLTSVYFALVNYVNLPNPCPNLYEKIPTFSVGRIQKEFIMILGQVT